MFFNSHLKKKVSNIIEKMLAKNLKIVTAESCTGGLLAALFTEISGSSSVFERGFVSYSNDAKKELLGVEEKTLEIFGAVSEQVAQEMSQGALKNSKADIAISITGVAGPDGGSLDKPVGLVYVAIADRFGCKVRKFNFAGDRQQVRESTMIAALNVIEDFS